SLDQRLVAEHRRDSLGQRLGAADDEQHPLRHIQPPILKAESSRVTSVLFSVVPSSTANGTLTPSAVTPRAPTRRWSAKVNPSMNTIRHRSWSSRRAISSANWSAVAWTNRRDTDDFEVPWASAST